MTRRTRILVLVAAVLGEAVGLVYVLAFDRLCMLVPVGPFGDRSCPHGEIFGLQPGALAVPTWAAIGLVGGGIIGLLASRVTRRT